MTAILGTYFVVRDTQRELREVQALIHVIFIMWYWPNRQSIIQRQEMTNWTTNSRFLCRCSYRMRKWRCGWPALAFLHWTLKHLRRRRHVPSKRREALGLTTHRHTLEDWNPQLRRCEELKIRTSKVNCDTQVVVLVSFFSEAADLGAFTLCDDAAK